MEVLYWETDRFVKKRLNNNREKLLHILIRAGENGISNFELDNSYLGKWSARMTELRRLGVIIKTKKVAGENGLYRYYYEGYNKNRQETPLMRLQTLISNEEFGVVDADRLFDLLIENDLFVSQKGNYEE